MSISNKEIAYKTNYVKAENFCLKLELQPKLENSIAKLKIHTKAQNSHVKT